MKRKIYIKQCLPITILINFFFCFQKELFASKIDAAEGGTGRDRKMSSSSTGSMKSKWLKAFKSLKTPTSSSSNGAPNKEGEK